MTRPGAGFRRTRVYRSQAGGIAPDVTSRGQKRDGARGSAWGLARGGRRAAALGTLLGAALALGTMPGASADPCGGFEAPCSQETGPAERLRQRPAPGHAERPQLRPGRAGHAAAARTALLQLLRRALRPVRLPLAADPERRQRRRAECGPAAGRGLQRRRRLEGRARALGHGRRDPRRRHRVEPARAARPDPPEHGRAALPRAHGRLLVRHLRLQRRRARQRRGLQGRPARRAVLARARGAVRADHRAGPPPRLRRLPDRSRPLARGVQLGPARRQRRQRLRQRHRRLELLRQHQRTGRHLQLLRRARPRHRPRARRGRAGQRRPGLDRRLPALPGDADQDVGHVRLRRATTSRSESSTRPTTAPG